MSAYMRNVPPASSSVDEGRVFACNEAFHLKDAEKAAGEDPAPNQPIPGTTFLSPVTKFFVKQTFTRFQK
jgi:hypothetical protein